MGFTKLILHKSGIALMVTVAILAMIAVVILGNLSLIDSAMQQTSRAKISTQNQAVLNSVKKFLDEKSQQINSPAALDQLLTVVAGLKDSKGLLQLDIKIVSLQGRVNINTIFGDNNKSIASHYEKMFLTLFDSYEIKNPDLLLAIIADTIDKDHEERYVDSELVNRYANISQGRIVNIEHLKYLSSFYDKASADSSVYKIPWEEFFNFGDIGKKTVVDCNYWDKNLAKYMGFGTNSDGSVSCDSIKNKKDLIKNFNVGEFKKNKSYWIEVTVLYKALNIKGKLILEYNLFDKGVRHIRNY